MEKNLKIFEKMVKEIHLFIKIFEKIAKEIAKEKKNSIFLFQIKTTISIYRYLR